MKVLVVLLATVVCLLCVSTEQTFDNTTSLRVPTEQTVDRTTSLRVPTEQTVDSTTSLSDLSAFKNFSLLNTLVSSDRYMSEVLLEPKTEERGRHLMEMITWYDEVMGHLIDHIKPLTSLQERPDLLEIFLSLQSTTGPRFLRVIPVYDIYVTAFRWSQFSLDNFKQILESAQTHWETLEHIASAKIKP